MRTALKFTLSLTLLLVGLSLPRPSFAQPLLLPHPCRDHRVSARLALFCDNFNSGQAEDWNPEGGNWSVVNGEYLGQATYDLVTPCGYVTSQTFVEDLDVRNLELSLDMTSIAQVDKLIVLRSADAEHQIELNFRAERPGAFPADLIVQERIGCQFILHTPEFSVLLPPHQVGETIHVRVRLVGQRLRVWTDQLLVLDQAFPFAAQTGRFGVGLIELGTTTFDNVKALVIR